MTADNVGFIATDDLTWSVPTHWRDKAFVPSGEFNVGRLPANSTITFPIEVVPIKRFQLPDDRAELRVDTNDILFVPRADDPKYDDGIDMIMIIDGNELDQWYVKFEANGNIDFYYSYANGSMYEFIYEDGNETILDIIITHDVTNFTGTERNRRRLLSIPEEVKVSSENENDDQTSIAGMDSDGSRNLFQIEKPLDCLIFIGCEYCSAVVGSKLKKVTPKICALGKKDLAPGVSIGVPTPWDKICGKLNPCNWVCPSSTPFRACTSFECNGPKKNCFEIGVPNIGDCRIKFPPPSPVSRPSSTPPNTKKPSILNPSPPSGGGARCKRW